jgi:Uma2 family endonuclease
LGLFWHIANFVYDLIMASSTLISAEEFDTLSRDSEARLEFLDGEVIEMSSPRPIHNLTLQVLMSKLDAANTKNPLGLWLLTSEFRLSATRRVIPDLALLLKPKGDLLDLDATPIELVPDLAVEIISPSETVHDVERKVFAYLEAGVTEVWSLIPAMRHIYKYTDTGVRLFAEGQRFDSTLLPGWSCPVNDIFEI